MGDMLGNYKSLRLGRLQVSLRRMLSCWPLREAFLETLPPAWNISLTRNLFLVDRVQTG
jgi:hypothetical protein